ncbi:hypothetical protein FQI92_23545 [Escherichia coli]|nr:hypothetical protein [Escherichia coli]
MKRLINLTPAEKRFLDDAVAAAERASGKKLNQPNRHIVLNRARAQIESQRQAGVSLEIGNFCTLSALFNQSWFVRG